MTGTSSIPKRLFRAIEELKGLQLELEHIKKNNNKLDVDKLVEATEKSSEVFKELNIKFEKMDNPPLVNFCNDLSKIINELHSMASNNNKPNLGRLKQVITVFEKFLDGLVTKSNRKKFRQAIAKIKIVDDLLYYCGNIPHYWEDATKAERLGLILGAVLVVAGVALTIAAFANPAIGPVVGGGFGIGLMASLGMALYTFALLGAKDRSQDKARIRESLDRLEKQKKNLDDFVKDNLLPYQGKEEIWSDLHTSAGREPNDNSSSLPSSGIGLHSPNSPNSLNND